MENHARIRQAIDRQNIQEVQTLITSHPHINYDRISPNGASALWWALIPPKGMTVSTPLVEFLLNNTHPNGSPLVNPVQDFAGLTPRQYLGLLPRGDFQSALEMVALAENNYQAPVLMGNNQRILARFANDGQSAHSSLVAPLARQNISRLHEHYVEKKHLALDEALLAKTFEEINAFIEEEAGIEPVHVSQMHSGLIFCFNNSSFFSFKSLDESDTKEHRLSLAELATLNWAAAKEKNPELLPADADNKDGLMSRKKAVLNVLFDIAIANGPFPSCPGGACNRFGMTLSAQHTLVHAYPKNTRLTGALAEFIIVSVLAQALEALRLRNGPAYLAVLRHLTLNDSQKQDEEIYQNYIESQQASLSKQLIEDEYIDTVLVTNCLNALKDAFYPAYPLTGHPISFHLQQMMSFFQAHEHDLSPFCQNKPLDDIMKEVQSTFAVTLSRSEAFKGLLKTLKIHDNPSDDLSLESAFITHWIERLRLEGTHHNLSAYCKGQAGEEASWFAVETLLLTLFLANKPHLKTSHPEQARWIDALTNQEIISLMVADNEKHAQLETTPRLGVLSTLLIQAIKLGITANLSLKGVHFKDLDLRAFNLSGVNLNDAILENCQLPLTGTDIQCKNIKLINCHLACTNENTSLNDLQQLFVTFCKLGSMPSALITQFFIQELKSPGLTARVFGVHQDTPLMIAIRYNRRKIVKAILDSEYCSTQLLEMSNLRGSTALHESVIYDEFECYKAILNNKHCKKTTFSITDRHGKTAFYWAAMYGYDHYLREHLNHTHCSSRFLMIKDEDGHTTLNICIRWRKTECVKAILASRHCTPELLQTVNNAGYVTLPRAAQLGNSQTLKYLVESKHCSPQTLQMTDEKGKTALCVAAHNGYMACVTVILASRHCTLAVITKKDDKGRSAADITLHQGQKTRKNWRNSNCTTQQNAQMLGLINRYIDYLTLWEGDGALAEKIHKLLATNNKLPSAGKQRFFNQASTEELLQRYQSNQMKFDEFIHAVSRLYCQNPHQEALNFIRTRLPFISSTDAELKRELTH